MILQRIITSIILGTLVIIGIKYSSVLYFNLSVSLIILMVAWEFSSLFKSWSYIRRSGFLVILVFTSYLVIHIAILPILIGGVLWWMIVAPYCLWQYAKKEDTYLSRIVWQEAMGIIMFVPAWISLIIIRQFFGVELLFCLLIMIWTIDCGAYFVGVYLGQHLLVPMISPKKTWEGLFGGFFLALLVTVLWVNHLNLDLRFTNKVIFWIIIFITCLWSIIGDLFESMLKRISQVKDSGILLPGHGGLFDRMDSLIAALPIFTLGLLVI